MAGEDHWSDRAVTTALEKIIEDIDDEWEDWKISATRMEAIAIIARPQLGQPGPTLDHFLHHYSILSLAVLGWRLQQATAPLRPGPPDQRLQWPQELL